MKTSKSILVAATLAVAIGSTYALAGSKKHGPERFPIDLNAAEQRTMDRFDAADTNDDERISVAEFQSQAPHSGNGWKHRRHGAKHHRGNSASHANKRANSALTDAEREQRRAARDARKSAFEEQLFAEMDANNDGQLSPTEASHENRKAATRQLHQARRFARLDADANGSLSREEFGMRLAHLRQADVDGDGFVSRDEAKTLRRHGGSHRNGS